MSLNLGGCLNEPRSGRTEGQSDGRTGLFFDAGNKAHLITLQLSVARATPRVDAVNGEELCEDNSSVGGAWGLGGQTCSEEKAPWQQRLERASSGKCFW